MDYSTSANTSTPTSSGLLIEKLAGASNYLTWKTRIQLVLMREGLWEVIVEDDLNDTTPSQYTVPEAGSAEATRASKTLAIIGLSLDQKLLALVRSSTTPSELWNRLRRQFERPTLANKIFFRRRLLKIRMDEGGDVDDYLNQLSDCIFQLSTIGIKVPDDEHVLLILSSLPPSFDALITSLESRAEALTVDFVSSRLRHEAAKRFEANASEAQASNAPQAFAASQPRRPQAPPANSEWRAKPTIFCRYCKKPNHSIDQCRKKKAADLSNKQQRNNNRNGGDATEPPHALFIDTFSNKEERDYLYIDSGASTHISCRRDWFSSFEEIEPRAITVADGRQIHATGIGQIKLLACTSFSGTSTRQNIITRVLFVPGVNK